MKSKIFQNKDSSSIVIQNNIQNSTNRLVRNSSIDLRHKEIFSKKEIESFNKSNIDIAKNSEGISLNESIDFEDNLIIDRENLEYSRSGVRNRTDAFKPFDVTESVNWDDNDDTSNSSSSIYFGSTNSLFNESSNAFEYYGGSYLDIGSILGNNLKTFTPSSLSKLLSRSLKNTEDFDLKVLSHELIKTKKSRKSIDTNYLFLYQDDISNSTFLNLKNESVDRIESIGDRLFKFASIEEHSDLIKESYDNALNIYNALDDATSFSNKLEKDINYGNIAEEFIINGSGKINGKISNIILESQEALIDFTGNDDERLLDVQNRNMSTNLLKKDLKIFYENISGFNLSSKNENFKDSFLNYEIINSDRLVGQLFLNCGISTYTLYPNIDDIESLSLKTKRDRVNSSYLQSYPIIQVANLNPNSRIFKINGIQTNYDILGIKGKSYNSSLIKSNADFTVYSSILNSNSDEKLIYKRQNQRDFLYSDRRSFLGKKNGDLRNFNNHVFTFVIESDIASSTDRNEVIKKSYYENIFFDVHTRSPYVSPSFIQLPTRFFMYSPKILDGVNLRASNIIEKMTYERLINQRDDLTQKFTDSMGLKVITTGNRNRGFQERYLRTCITLMQEIFSVTYLDRYVDNISAYFQDKLLRDFSSNYEIKFKGIGLPEQSGRSIRISNNSSIRIITELLDNYFESDTFNLPTSAASITSSNGQPVQNLSSIENNFNSNIGFLGINNEDFLSDIYTFSTSNSFLSKKELNNFSLIRVPFTKIKDSAKYIKTEQEKKLNKSKVSENLKNITSFTQDSINKYVIKTSSGCNLARRNLSKMSNKFYEMTQKANNKISQKEEFTLLYDSIEDTSIDTFEKSPFISDNKIYKNNFAKKFSKKINNSSIAFIDNDLDIDDNSHIFSSKDYREFLSKYYTKSFLRNKKSLFLKLVKENINIYKSNSYSNDEYFGFDMLLSKALSNNNSDKNTNKDLVEVILKNAIMNMSGIDSQISNFKKEPIDSFKKLKSSNYQFNQNVSSNREYTLNNSLKKEFGKEKIEKAISSIFSLETIKNQENFVIRHIEKDYLDINKFAMSTKNCSGDGFLFKNIKGDLCTLKFPFIAKKHKFDGSGNINISNKIQNFNKLQDSEEFSRADCEDYMLNISNFLKNSSYNHDIFISEEDTGIVCYKTNQDKVKVIKGYTLDEDQIEKGLLLNISYYDFDFNNTGLTSYVDNFLTSTYQDSFEGEEKFITRQNFRNSIINSETIYGPYSRIRNNVKIPFSYFYLSGIPGTFSNKLTEISEDLLKVFNVNFESINNLKDIDKFIESNSFYVRILQEIFEVFSEMFNETNSIYINLLLEEIKTNISDISFYDNIESFYSFSNNQEFKDLAVSDLMKIYKVNMLELENNSFVKYKSKNDFININNFRNEVIDEDNIDYIHTGRFRKFQEVLRLLSNSDISEAICHDLLHGYFLNFENNVERLEENTESLERSIQVINNEILKIEEIEFEDFNKFIKNEFYQNKVSKDMQEIMFYKNMYNETFISNSFFNTLREKYESINIFNHRKVYIKNMFDKARASCNFFASDLMSNTSKKIDIIRIPIDYDLVNKIGERGIIEISILPVNIKYPEIEYKELKFYYAPFLTDVSSNFISEIGNRIDRYLGFYNDAKKISNRYCIISKEDAVREINNTIINILNLNSDQNEEVVLEDSFVLSEKIVNDCVMSNAIKSMNIINQKGLDENIKIVEDDINNLISGKTINMLSNISEDDLVKIFDTYNENDLSFVSDDEYFNLDSNLSILRSNDFYKKFLLELDKDTSNADIVKCIIPNVFYDMFNIKLDRDIFETQDSEESIIHRYRSNILLEHEANKCFSYYIGARIL